MSKSFIHQHIKNIQKQRDSSASSVPVKTTPITSIIVNQDNITSSNLTVVIKEISRIKEAQQAVLKTEEDRIAKEKEITALAEAERLKLEQLKLEQAAAEQERIRQQQLETQRLAILEQERLAQEAEERLEFERQRLVKEQAERQERLDQEQIIITHIEPEPLHPIAEVQENNLQREEITEPIIADNQIQATLPIIEELQEVQYVEEHHQEVEIQGIQEQLVMEAQGGGEENDSEDLDRASDFSNVSGSEEWEYVGLTGEHQEL